MPTKRKPKFTGPMRVRGAVGPEAVAAAKRKQAERTRRSRERKAARPAPEAVRP